MAEFVSLAEAFIIEFLENLECGEVEPTPNPNLESSRVYQNDPGSNFSVTPRLHPSCSLTLSRLSQGTFFSESQYHDVWNTS
ncbi:hypothetical protein DTO013E5_9621 [Penicillium roqueforti]|uniref:uncharacterized protein n=1 Tax=Penicillium roqueforti TaxID=5082 RepID=UPI001909ACEA|nr:uncharacterized protein LCP9604111_6350 [Penicillium roqueforti]KAF9247651.1 hypothetical protein LCP9604111_6350 [Penicillium roqueforti]KAI1834992.1 hypothetical protein CBS147337_4546 [Penicillium roqueforti]KAI2676831.1 hypothetical protein CBS147355_5933 [Penicillium roqueforti]KAI2683705.1 hypothetical protein LCP963914a_6106 [Penicillium roqueforti]KAI2703150.1 hypothetical protein CBS147372_3465 [Penicillium roqueforti]